MDLAPYLAQIRAWNPSLDIRSVRVDPYGLNNLVIMVNEEWVFRFPRDEASRARLFTEAQMLALVRRHVSIAVPNFEFDEAWGFVAYPLLPGRPMYRHVLLRLSDAAQELFAADLAVFLSQLHAIQPEVLIAAGFSSSGTHDLASPGRWAERLDAIRVELYPLMWADQHAYVEDLLAPALDGRLETTYTPALIHNDLASYHLLGDQETGRLSGVLDFESGGLGDPASDYGLLINTYGESLVSRMARYDPEIKYLIDRARLRAGYLELDWALQGIKTNNPEWFLVHIGRARDSKPITL